MKKCWEIYLEPMNDRGKNMNMQKQFKNMEDQLEVSNMYLIILPGPAEGQP